MSLIVNEGAQKEHYVIPADTYPAICYQLIDLGLQYNEQYGNTSRKVLIGWEIPDETYEYDGKTYTRTLSQKYTASLNSKSALRRDLIAWRGRDFTDEELAAFDLKNIVGKHCLLTIVHREYNGKTYANIASITKMPKGSVKPAATRAPEVYDIDADDPARVEEFPDWIKDQIKNSESYVARLEQMAEADPVKAPEIVDLDDDDESGLPF